MYKEMCGRTTDLQAYTQEHNDHGHVRYTEHATYDMVVTAYEYLVE